MNRILELREKRAKAWDAAKKFLDAKTGPDGLVSAEDSATYDKMEADVLALGKEVERLERQAAIDAALNAPANQPITEKPGEKEKAKAGRASAEYAAAFWQAIRSKSVPHEIFNALETGTDSEGGYLVPDEYQRTLIDALQEQNIFRQLAHVITTTSGERKIPVVASHGTAAWIDEEGSYPESDDAFGQVSIGSYKLATMIKVSEELLNDSAFDVPACRTDGSGWAAMIVSVEELKAHLRIQQDAEEALLERLLHQAQAAANDFCRTDFDADAPEPVRLAVLLMASHFYEYRDASDRSAYLTMMNAFHALLYPYRKIEDMF